MPVSSPKLLIGYPVTEGFVISLTVSHYMPTSFSIMKFFDIRMEFPTWSLTMTFVSFKIYLSSTTRVCSILLPRPSLHHILNSDISISDQESPCQLAFTPLYILYLLLSLHALHSSIFSSSIASSCLHLLLRLV